MKKILIFALLILVSSASRADMNAAEMDLYCSGMLLRTAGLIRDNISHFSGDAESQLSKVISHFDNNGAILLDRATKITGFTVSAKGIAAIGMNYAEKQIGNNVMNAIRSGTEQHKALMSCLQLTSNPTSTPTNATSTTSSTTPSITTPTSSDFRKVNQQKILRVYDLIRTSVEKINDTGEQLSETERADRAYSFLVNRNGDGFWFAAACQASYDLQLSFNKDMRRQEVKNFLWEDKQLEQKKIFYVAILERNFQLLGKYQYDASYDLAQKETHVFFYDLQENGTEKLRLEKINDYLLQCNRLSSVYDSRELPIIIPAVEKSSSKDSDKSANPSKEVKNRDNDKKLDRRNIKAEAKEGCTQLIKQSWEKNGTDEYGRKIQQNFVQIFPSGPYGPGKYGENYFYAFNLALNKGSSVLEFALDCIFDADGKVLGTEYRK
jgi:hypothetical protein